MVGAGGGELRILADMLEERTYGAADFHSVGYLPGFCVPPGPVGGEPEPNGAAAGPPLSERMVLRAPLPESCSDVWQHNCTTEHRNAAMARRKVRIPFSSASSGVVASSPGISLSSALPCVFCFLDMPSAVQT